MGFVFESSFEESVDHNCFFCFGEDEFGFGDVFLNFCRFPGFDQLTYDVSVSVF